MRRGHLSIATGAALVLCLLVLPSPTRSSGLLPTFSKLFAPDTIGPGSSTTLSFTITNPDPDNPISGMAFVDNLPAGVTIADPANLVHDCGQATLSAPVGGGTITLSDGELGSDSSCTISVDVTSSTVATHTNVSGDFTSSAGNSGSATDDLFVQADILGFTKAFSPDSVVSGDTSTLTFTIDNSLNGALEFFISFNDNLPAGLVVASPSNASSDCDEFGPPTITATPGSSVISFSGGSVAANSSCTFSVDVMAQTAGPKGNTSGEIFFGGTETGGRASATLDVTRGFLRKLFPDDPVAPGGLVTLEFTITNFDRENSVTDISFTDDLDAALSGLAAVGLPLADPCGAGSQLAGTGFLSFSGGNLAPEATCVFSATLQVPPGASPGSYVNTTSSVVTFVDGDLVVEDPAADDLIVSPVPIFTKSFIDDPVTGGDQVTLRFTIENTDPVNTATDIEFFDEITAVLPFPVSATLPADGFCGAGSSLGLFQVDVDTQHLVLTGGELAGGANCTFDVLLDVPVGFPPGLFLNQTSEITATIDNELITGNPATDFLESVSAPALVKEFTDDPVLPGDTVTLEFTLTLTEEAPGDVTDISFSDDLDAVIMGLEATGLPANDVCGAGSVLSGTSLITLTGGSLSPATSCTFQVTLQVPGGVLPGDYPNTTSDVSGMASGATVTSSPAEGDLTIAGLSFTKTFDDPVVAGGVVSLEFQIVNSSPTEDATDMTFSDDLDAELSGLAAIGLPLNDICGNGSSLSELGGPTLLLFENGSLSAGTSCTFSVDLQVPGSADVGDYTNVTSGLGATFGGNAVAIDPASDVLTIFEPLTLSKLFDDPVAPGDTVDLEFTIFNADAVQSITDIDFTDDLGAALAGLEAVGLPANDVCGAGSQISGTDLLALTGGSLAPDSSCVFVVSVQTPVVPSPTTAANVTSEVTGMIAGVLTTGPAATDELLIEEPICTALDGESMVFSNDTIDDAQSFELCDEAVLGPNLSIVGPNGSLTLQLGKRAVLENGTSILTGGTLIIGIDETLKP